MTSHLSDANFYEKLVDATERAMRSSSAEGVPGLSGYSGKKIIALLQNLAGSFGGSDRAYVEVGVFQGLTLLSVAHAAPAVPAFGIDNYSQFDPNRTNRSVVESRKQSLGAENAQLIDEDFEVALTNLRDHIGSRDVGVYFVDGPHDYRSQLMCLQMMLPYLADNAVMVIDDCNYEHVRQANADFLRTHPDFALVFEAYTGTHPSNMDEKAQSEARSGWWNGINLLVKDPDHFVERTFPQTGSDRSRYVNEHIVHGERNGDLAPEAVALADAVLSWNPVRIVSRVAKLHRAAKSSDRHSLGDFKHCNVGEVPVATRWPPRHK